MRGRDIFRRASLLIKLLTMLSRVLPRPIFVLSWCWLDLLPGLLGVGMRYIYSKRLAKAVGDNVYWGRSVEVVSWEKLVIGSNVSIHKDCYIDASGLIEICDDVSIAHNTSLVSFDHTWEDLNIPIRSNVCSFAKITINDDVWIGCGVRVLSGVDIRSRTVIAAGAVLTKGIYASHAIYAGVPAKKIKEI